MNLDDKQAELSDAIADAEALVEALKNAETCESEADFKANVADAKMTLRALMAALETL